MNPRHLPAIPDRPTPATPALRLANPHHPATLAETEAGPDWRRLASALLRFKWVVILMVVLGLAGAFAATRVLRPVYRAQANVWGDVPDRRGDAAADARGPIRQGALLDADAWVELLRAYIVLDQVVRDLRLYLAVQRPSDRTNFIDFHVADTFRPGEYQLRISPDGREYPLASADGTDLDRGPVGHSGGSRLSC